MNAVDALLNFQGCVAGSLGHGRNSVAKLLVIAVWRFEQERLLVVNWHASEIGFALIAITSSNESEFIH